MNMLRSRALRKLVAVVGGAAMLIVQVSMAAEGCMLQPASTDPAPIAESHADAGQSPCHEMDTGSSGSTCAQRCDLVKQSQDHQPPSFTPVLAVLHPVEPPAPRFTPSDLRKEPHALLTRATAPPLSVRNCCFRT